MKTIEILFENSFIPLREDDSCGSKGPSGFYCSLTPKHIGPHLALASEPLEVCALWVEQTLTN